MANRYSSLSLGAFVGTIMSDVAVLCSELVKIERNNAGQKVDPASTSEYSAITYKFANRLVERLGILEPINDDDNTLSSLLSPFSSGSVSSTSRQQVQRHQSNASSPLAISVASSPTLIDNVTVPAILTPAINGQVVSAKKLKTASLGPPKKIKVRSSYTVSQKKVLDAEYAKEKFCSASRKTLLARALGLTERQVKVWFRNRRFKERAGIGMHAIGTEPNPNGPQSSGSSTTPPSSFPPYSNNNNNNNEQTLHQDQYDDDDRGFTRYSSNNVHLPHKPLLQMTPNF